MTRIFPLNENIFQPADLKKLQRLNRLTGSRVADVQALHIVTQYLPHLIDKVGAWQNGLLTFEQQLRATRTGVTAYLTLAVANLDELASEQSTAPASELLEIRGDIEDTLNTTLEKLDSYTTKLTDSSALLLDNLDALALSSFRTSLEKTVEENIMGIAEADNRLQAIRSDREVISTAINAIEGVDLESIVGTTTLTAEALLKANVEPPKIALVQAALDLTKKLVGDIQQGFDLLNLINQRDLLTARIARILQQQREAEDTLGQYRQRIRLIEEVEQFDILKRQALLAGVGIQQTLSTVVQNGRRVNTEESEEVARFVRLLRTLMDYMKGV